VLKNGHCNGNHVDLYGRLTTNKFIGATAKTFLPVGMWSPLKVSFKNGKTPSHVIIKWRPVIADTDGQSAGYMKYNITLPCMTSVNFVDTLQYRDGSVMPKMM